MGALLCCCRPRRRTSDPEREPLLPKDNPPDNPLPPPTSSLEHLADAFAALRAGKLPSEAQLENFLDVLLRTGVLDEAKVAEGLSERGRRVLGDVSEVVQVLREIGKEKNADDKVQDLVYALRHVEGHSLQADIAVRVNSPDTSVTDGVEAVVDALPTKDEVTADFALTLQSFRQLLGLVLTSSTFRLLLSDSLITVRAVVADAAANVGSLAAQVQGVAASVEEATRPDGKDVSLEDVQARAAEAGKEAGAVGEETRERWERLARESPERVRESIVGRVQNIVIRAQQTPAYRASLLTLLALVQKYTTLLRELSATTTSAVLDTSSSLPTVTLQPLVWPDPQLARAFSLLGILLERITHRPLDPFLSLAQRVVMDIIRAPGEAGEGSRRVFMDANAWLQRALTQDGYASSSQGTRDAEVLYDRLRSLLQSSNPITSSEEQTPLGRDLSSILAEVDLHLAGLYSDTSLSRLHTALTSLRADLSVFLPAAVATTTARTARAVQNARTQLARDALSFVLPRLLRALRAVPMPRVEYASPILDAAVDALLLTAPTVGGETHAHAALVPDAVKVWTWSEVAVDFNPPPRSTARSADGTAVPPIVPPAVTALFTGEPAYSQANVRTATRVRVHVDGLRVSAHDVGYLIRYKGLLSYLDTGLISLDVGRPGVRGEGVKLELELEVDTGEYEENAAARPLFKVHDVKVDVPGLAFRIDRSRHWILNKLLLQPVVAPAGRAVLRLLVGAQVRALLERLGEAMGEVKKGAEQRAKGEGTAGVSEWMDALGDWAGGGEDDSSDTVGDEDEAEVETHITPTAKGIVRTTITHPKSPSGEETTTQLAVGVGPQVLPDIGPHALDPEAPAEVAREALEEIQEGVERVEGEVEEVAKEAVEARAALDKVGARVDVRERVEERRKGWRSAAFDF